MQKAKQYNIADSNIANLGSELEKNVKLAAAQTEDAWKTAGKAPGIQVWRIEKFKVVPVPPANYGTFYSGDSYIVLYTYKPAAGKEILAFDVHFWLGTYTSQDEAGTAAYKTVELDDYLGGLPVQYREVQGHESSRFQSHFPKGLRILEGGVDTGFKHVEHQNYRPRLLHVKGARKNVRVHEVDLTTKSLNSGDVFILDGGLDIIQWNGSKSGAMERAKGQEISQAIEGEREGKAHNRVVDEGAEDDAFWKMLGGKGPIASAEAGGSDTDEKRADPPKKLFRLSDASGKFEFTAVAEGPKVSKALLDTNDVFILDTGAEVYAWVGKKASAGERKKALTFAQEYVTKSGKPTHTTVVRILEGGENEVFEASMHN